MLVASGVLFYVSYWLISQLEAKRWMDFLKQQARHGLELGGQGTLAVTAFLAVYREGAETSLMYQALLGSEGRTQAGFLGLAAGFVLGMVLLAVIAMLIRATSVRLPMQRVLQVLGHVSVRPGHRVRRQRRFRAAERRHPAHDQPRLDGPRAALGGALSQPQVISVQGLLLAGAILAWVVIPRAVAATRPRRAAQASSWPPSEAESTRGSRRAPALGRSDRGRADPGRRDRCSWR